MGADLLFTGVEKRIRSWLFKRGSCLDFCNRPYQPDSISQVIHSWIKLWRLYEKNVTPFSLEVNLGRFRDILQVAMTTDVQPKFSYLSFLAGKSTEKISSGFEMWCFEIRNCNAWIYKKHKAISWKTQSSISSEYPKNHYTKPALYYQLFFSKLIRTKLIVFTDERVINEGIERKGHKTLEDGMRNQRKESEKIQQNEYATYRCNLRIFFSGLINAN